MQQSVDSLLDHAIDGHGLARAEMAEVFEWLMAGRLDAARVESFLVALADRGETVDEIIGAAEVMRRHVTPIRCDDVTAIDTCGTGGDGICTFNVSTAAAIIAAGAGATVAKHGNRTNSRASGSAEVLAALGVNIEASPQVVERCLREIGIGFLFAAKLHPAMANVVAIRRKIGRPTIFNYLGPLTNPARVRRQIIGVPREMLVEKVAAALAMLGVDHAFVVHGRDGLCDLTITGASACAEVRDGRIVQHDVRPEDAGLPSAALERLLVTSPAESAEAIRAILNGQRGPRRDHALLNAAIALMAAGRAGNLRIGAEMAAASIDSDAAAGVLSRLVKLSGGAA